MSASKTKTPELCPGCGTPVFEAAKVLSSSLCRGCEVDFISPEPHDWTRPDLGLDGLVNIHASAYLGVGDARVLAWHDTTTDSRKPTSDRGRAWRARIAEAVEDAALPCRREQAAWRAKVEAERKAAADAKKAEEDRRRELARIEREKNANAARLRELAARENELNRKAEELTR